MSHSPKSDNELFSLNSLVKSFLLGFERLYVQNDPEKVLRCRLCIWQLIHVHSICHGMVQSDLGLKLQLSGPLWRLVIKFNPKKLHLPILLHCFLKGQMARH